MRFWALLGEVPEAIEELTPRQREVLSAVAALGQAGVDEIRRRMVSPPSPRMVQRVLAVLVEHGRVARSGKGRSTRYSLVESRH